MTIADGRPKDDGQQSFEVMAELPPPKKGLPRAADLVIATAALVVVSPLLAIAAIAIKLESRGPVFYRQRRVGKGGEVFELFKLRTMRQGADPIGVGTAVTSGDPRVTRVGRLLRRFALDELPNLINVLRGEMRIVGPRATLPAQVQLYTPRQRRRLDLRPGVTGWAQIHGRAGIPWEERIELDVWYVEHRSLWLDLKILAKTPAALLGGAGDVAPDPYAGSPPDSPLRQAAEREHAEER
ncbi:MAG TPA: sugar transferase [Solirubrobacterales bacterium]|nr:sugar transferase [Solirubrobacterales bacterium]